MDKLKNYANIRFTNAVLIDIFSHYADNSAMAEFVSADGSVDITFRIKPPVEPPKNSEQVLSLMFALFESNAESAMGRTYMAHQKDILRETVLRLSHVIESFSDIKMSIHTSVPASGDTDKEIESHTEFTLTRSRTSHKI
ncbi:MAG: hypothetical protein IIZ53_01265 [Ruminococcus sp.]|nr:hypothetical protein [Ruminococcus sp.]